MTLLQGAWERVEVANYKHCAPGGARRWGVFGTPSFTDDAELLGRGAVREKQIQFAILIVEHAEGVGRFFQHLPGHGNRIA
jgi:hypothetical protein